MSEPVRIDGDTLHLRGGVSVSFLRTLRIPETGLHPLPPGLGTFPLRRVEDYPQTVPAPWLERGGVMLPIYQREALWMSFDVADAPAALQVATGKVCAVSGRPFSSALSSDPQNYLPLPDQPWLDGINAGDGFIRQFVAVPLGLGATVEGQVTGSETVGGVQLQTFALTEAAREVWQAEQARGYDDGVMYDLCMAAAPPDMGLGGGGRMRQEVYRDDRPLSDYRSEPAGRVFVHLCSAAQWQRITGELPPPTPVSPQAYTAAGLPWFEYYDADADDLAASDELARVRPVGDWLGDDQSPWVAPTPGQTVRLGDPVPGTPVTEGAW